MSQNIERVASSKNGSRNAVVGSGLRSMSLSLICWYPRTDEPSNPTPLWKVPSSAAAVGTVT